VTHPYPVVEVTWQDGVLLDGWQDIAELSWHATTVITVGFLVHEDEHSIHVAAAIHGDEAAGVIVIPKGVIMERRTLAEGRP